MKLWIQNEKKVIVEAEQLTSDNAEELAKWCGGKIVEERDPISNRLFDGINVPTPVGMKRLSITMYLVKFQGAFYLAKRGVFERAYSPMSAKKDEPKEIPVTQNPRDSKIMGRFAGPPWFDGRKD